jgi:hypothetical protein
MEMFVATATKETKPRYAGLLQTDWGSADKFVNDFREIKDNGAAAEGKEKSAANTFFLLTRMISGE